MIVPVFVFEERLVIEKAFSIACLCAVLKVKSRLLLSLATTSFTSKLPTGVSSLSISEKSIEPLSLKVAPSCI